MSFYTQGNNIFNHQGEIVRLKGVSRTGLEYSYVDLNAMIPETIDFDIHTMKEWGFNSIRFPLRDHFWLNDMEYKKKIQYWVDQTLQNDMIAVLDLHTQQDHPGMDPFMLRSSGIVEFWEDLARTYQNTSQVFFEIFNEPHGITPLVWWEGNDMYHGYKEILGVVRSHADNICLIGGLDYAYQFNFLSHNKTLLKEVRNISNLALAVHPYGYKGRPVNLGVDTDPIPTTILTNTTQNYTGDCHLGITVPTVPPSQYGWEESFGFLIRHELFPVVATEWGLDRPDNCIQGGWYNVEILEYMNSLNMSYMAWAWVQDRLDYPSLLDEDFQPTGHGTRATVGPACSGVSNKYYQGPGMLVKNDLQSTKRSLSSCKQRAKQYPPPPCSSFQVDWFLIFVGIFFLFHVLFFCRIPHSSPSKRTRQQQEQEPPIHRTASSTILHSSIRIRSCQSFPQLLR